MMNVEKKELAKKLGVDNILINYFADWQYKNNLTVFVNKDLLLHYVGKTYSFVPLTADGINKQLSKKDVNELLNKIEIELNNEIEKAKVDIKETKKNKDREDR